MYHNSEKGTTVNSLSLDVPIGYFLWAEYDIMAPVQPKTEKTLAAAFISNCDVRNFRLQALDGLEKAYIKIDSYGGCHRNYASKGCLEGRSKRNSFSTCQCLPKDMLFTFINCGNPFAYE
ncbi:hypothetical protein CTI12_AA094120 [Artemisia annua]|uniref:Uncharacterized protein n=1 Tax=Artemisia annua TaxID=35608 RepID=A0A2U1PWW8_ARTAN|nr:hypothetical protein CTI12_AA094120 [Artemisia annua]